MKFSEEFKDWLKPAKNGILNRMDRFQLPDSRDEKCQCAECGMRVLPEYVDDEGVCQECRGVEE